MGFDIVEILSKINKAAIFFFLATLVFLAYEFYLFRKDRAKKGKLKVPQFNTASATSVPPIIRKAAPTAQFAPPAPKKRGKKALVMVVSIFLMLGLGGFIAYRLNTNSGLDSSVAPANPRATDETITSDLTNSDATPSAQANTTASASASTTTSTPSPIIGTPSATLAPTAVLSKPAATAAPSATPTATNTPTVVQASPSAQVAAETAVPTAIAQLPETADSSSAPYTMFIFIAAITTFFVAFLF